MKYPSLALCIFCLVLVSACSVVAAGNGGPGGGGGISGSSDPDCVSVSHSGGGVSVSGSEDDGTEMETGTAARTVYGTPEQSPHAVSPEVVQGLAGGAAADAASPDTGRAGPFGGETIGTAGAQGQVEGPTSRTGGSRTEKENTEAGGAGYGIVHAGLSSDYSYSCSNMQQGGGHTASGGPGRIPVPGTHTPYGEVPYGHLPAARAVQTIVTESPAHPAVKRRKATSPGQGEVSFVADDGDRDPLPSPRMNPVACLLLLPGFSRLNRKNVLKNRNRDSIYGYICTHPGTDLGSIAETLASNRETTRYHIRILVSRGLVTEFRKGGSARYFQNNGVFPAFKKTLVHYLSCRTPRKMIVIIRGYPGLSRQEIADRLGIAGPSVTWHARRLEKDGLVRTEVEGLHTRYYLTESACRHMDEIASPAISVSRN